MRLPTLIALAALAGLAACDSAKRSELTGTRPEPATAQIAAAPTAGPQAVACPPTPAPACPPAAPAMAPEAAKVPAAVPAAAAKVRRVKAHRAAWRAPAPRARHVHHRAATMPPVRHYAYAGGYTGRPAPAPDAHHGGGHMGGHHMGRFVHPPVYARPGDSYGRDEQYSRSESYERRDEGVEGGYRYERREGDYDHAPYVEERREERRDGYAYERRESGSEHGAWRYERRESGYSSGGGGVRPDDCDCRPQAAGRDRMGFLTWPGKQP
ncbi:MAG TPA: hypothetical protein VFW47_18355 [Phenylobacterium sp.]|nr:hypothetical protein [Phenylobacterium sp.]